MRKEASNIHSLFSRMLPREQKEFLLRQRGLVVWLFGLSGAGKSTIAVGLEAALHRRGVLTQLLDGDNIRSSLNRDLGFSDADREENIRRIAEVARLHASIGVVAIISCITPKRKLRQTARKIIGGADYWEVFVSCAYETCERRDVKGLYAKARAGNLAQFTGKDSAFEGPDAEYPPKLTIATDGADEKESVAKLLDAVFPRTRLAG